MIDKSGGIYNLICDICGGEAEESFFEFYDAVNYKKREGWKSQKDKDGAWEDVCPECQELN
mgnify:CR=1 FL=1